MLIRQGRFLVCHKDHCIGGLQINYGTKAIIEKIDEKCLIKIGNKKYSVSENLISKNWNLDLTSELVNIGIKAEHLNKINFAGQIVITQKLLSFSKSGIDYQLCRQEISDYINNCIMCKALF